MILPSMKQYGVIKDGENHKVVRQRELQTSLVYVREDMLFLFLMSIGFGRALMSIKKSWDRPAGFTIEGTNEVRKILENLWQDDHW